MQNLWEQLGDFLDAGEAVVVATIVDHSGSTPRTSGSRMVVRSGGRIAGTIGGGRLEAEVMKDAAAMLGAEGARVRSFRLDAGDVVDTMDMICGGRVTVLLESLPPGDPGRDVFDAVRDRSRKGPRSLLVTRLEDGPGVRPVGRCLIDEEGESRGDAFLPPGRAREIWRRWDGRRSAAALEMDGAALYLFPVLGAETVFLFGAGHVSREVSRLCPPVGFRTVVVDDRPEFANVERFRGAGDIRVVNDFSAAFDGLAVDGDGYVAILTRGHRHDQTVLSQALRTRAGYIGMIGSRRKRDSVYDALVKEGFSLRDLDRVHCPIGIEIHAETPEEIAVSIVAELIAHRAAARRAR